jgi:hypothetical protein
MVATEPARRCILCLSEKAGFAPEHVFPEAIGGLLTVTSVCTNCNHRLGTDVDSHLTDHWLIQSRRRELGLRGKGGDLPNVRMVGTVDGMPDVRVIMQYDSNDKLSVRVQPSVRSTVGDDGKPARQVLVDDADLARLPAIVNKIRARAGMTPLPPTELAQAHTFKTIRQPRVTITPDIDIHDYRRAIVKIAYELAHRWLGDLFIGDAMAQVMRDIILNSSFSPEDFERSALRGQILIGEVLPELPLNSSVCHLAYLTRHGSELAIGIQIFDLFQACLVVSTEADQYANRPDMAVLMNVEERTLNEASMWEVIRQILELARTRAG